MTWQIFKKCNQQLLSHFWTPVY